MEYDDDKMMAEGYVGDYDGVGCRLPRSESWPTRADSTRLKAILPSFTEIAMLSEDTRNACLRGQAQKTSPQLRRVRISDRTFRSGTRGERTGIAIGRGKGLGGK